jgi:hypothetical protein
MAILARRFWCIAVMVLASLSIASGTALADPSPTGRTPKLGWTPERQGVWNRMKADYDANPGSPATLGGQWYQALMMSAANGGNPLMGSQVYVLLYQITGNAAYAQQAYGYLQTEFFNNPDPGQDGNFVREASIPYVIYYDWLYPGLSDPQRAVFQNKLNQMLVTANTKNYRLEDSDQVVGTYFGMVLWYLESGSYNPTAVNLYQNASVPLGGLDATASDRTTMRNDIRQFVTQLAAGGEWIESTEYNPGTTRLLLRGYDAVRTATGVDHFPEITAWLQDTALRPAYLATPDLLTQMQWGDEENPRGFRKWDWQMTDGIVAGLTQGTPNGPYIQDFTIDLVDKFGYGPASIESGLMLAQGLSYFNPYASRGDRTTLPKNWYAKGQGLSIYHDGWAPADSMVALHFPPSARPFVDHAVDFFGDFQLYRKGEWALTHPLTYSGVSDHGDGVNAILYGGAFSSMVEYGKVTHEQGGDYLYMSGTTGGQAFGEGSFYQPPPTFLHEGTRSILYLPSIDKRSDTLVIFDRINALPPQSLPSFDRYYPNMQQAIQQSPLKQLFFHMPVQPAIGPGTVSWKTPGGQSAIITTLLPAAAGRVAVDENLIYPLVTPSERKWQVQITPATVQQWDTFLNVVQVHDGIAIGNTGISSSAGDIQGAVLHRQDLNDAVVLFNARQGANLANWVNNGFDRSIFPPVNQALLDQVRLLSAGYTVTFASTTALADAFLMDLNPTGSWMVSIDGGADANLTVSTAGMARIALSGAGQHMIRVSALGGLAPQPPSGLRVVQ